MVSSVLGTTHFVRVPRRTQEKKERRQGAAALPLTSDTARGFKHDSRRRRRRLRSQEPSSARCPPKASPKA